VTLGRFNFAARFDAVFFVDALAAFFAAGLVELFWLCLLANDCGEECLGFFEFRVALLG
jgi:hypothetical protein